MGPIRGPSVESMYKKLHITKEAAKGIKWAMDFNRPQRALRRANLAMGGSGVEELGPNFPDFKYVNMGKTYATTLCYTGNSFYIGSWGDWVERHSGKG